MTRYARIESDLVVELLETDADISKMFHPDMQWVAADDGVQVGDAYAAGEFSRPVFVAPALTEQQVIKSFERAVTAYLDGRAQEKGYATIINAALRAGYPGPYHAEGVAAATWMDACWHYCYAALADVKSGRREQPTQDQLIAELPTFEWPT